MMYVSGFQWKRATSWAWRFVGAQDSEHIFPQYFPDLTLAPLHPLKERGHLRQSGDVLQAAHGLDRAVEVAPDREVAGSDQSPDVFEMRGQHLHPSPAGAQVPPREDDPHHPV